MRGKDRPGVRAVTMICAQSIKVSAWHRAQHTMIGGSSSLEANDVRVLRIEELVLVRKII